MAESSRKVELLANLDVARAEMSAHGMAVRRAMNVGKNLNRSVQQHRSVWFGGAGLLGLLLSLTVASRRKVVVKEVRDGRKARSMAGGFASGLLTLASALGKPVLQAWLKTRMNERSKTEAGR